MVLIRKVFLRNKGDKRREICKEMDNLPQIRMLNDPESTEMWIAGAIRDYSRLGADIGENTHVETLRVNTKCNIEPRCRQWISRWHQT